MRTTTPTMLFAILLFAAADANAAKTRTVTFDAAFGAPRVSLDADGFASVRVDGAGARPTPGAPSLPHRHLRLVLPPDADLGSVRVRVEPFGVETREGPFDVAPAPPYRVHDTGAVRWGAAEDRIVGGRDAAIYGRDARHPAAWGEAKGAAAEVRGFKSIEIALSPARWSPRSMDLETAEALRVVVTYAAERAPTAPKRGCSIDDELAARLFDNFADAAAWYGEACTRYPAPGDDGIAVITTDDIEDESLLLGDWVALRESQGYTVTVATDADFDVSTGDPTEDTRADRIRKWLKDNWAPLGLGWAFLVGNPDPSDEAIYGVPMKPCAASAEEGWVEIAPTDFYYANLTGDFDADGDGEYCEVDDEVSFVPDIYVGRLPCYSDGASAIDEMLGRILAYEEESATGDLEWRRRALLPDSIYWYKYEGCSTLQPRWDGATIAEWLIREELEPRGMVWTSLYERDGIEPSQFFSHFPIDMEHVVNQWALGYGLVYWAGHGSTSGAYRTIWGADTNGNLCADEEQGNYETYSLAFMESATSYMLEDAPPPFVVHDSCSNATPESPDNLAYNLLRRGAIATMAATRVAYAWSFPYADPELWIQSETIDGDSSDMGTEFAQNVIAGSAAGQALGDTIAVTTDGQGLISMYQKSNMNLYGDPLVRLVMCRVGAECDDGDWCDGLEWCDEGSCQPGTPVVCEPTDECEEMVCDEAADACVWGQSCIPDGGIPDAGPPPEPDAGTDTEQPAATSGISAGSSSCSAAPRAATRSLLSSIF